MSRAQSLAEAAAEIIVADLGDHADGIAEPAHGYRLIGALAAVKGLKLIAPNGLSGRRNFLSHTDQIEIDATDHHNGFTHTDSWRKAKGAGKLPRWKNEEWRPSEDGQKR